MKLAFTISGTGCALVDYLYKPIDFSAGSFKRFISARQADGGLSPGKLVFTEEFEKFSGEPYAKVRNLITGGMPPVAVTIGGPSIVSLIHASQMLHGTPAEVRFYGCRGADQGGGFIEEKLKSTPLGVGFYKAGTQFTPFTDVLSDPDFEGGQGERIFINNIGAAWEFNPGDLDHAFFSSHMVVFGGTALVPHIHLALEELLDKAKRHNAFTVVNTVYDFLNEKKNPSKPWPLGRSMKTYKNIDLLITDMEEAFRLSGSASAEAAASFFRSAGTGAVVITQGSRPVHYFSQSQLFGNIPLTQLPVSARIINELTSDERRAGDTTGCGDNFAGGVIASLAMQMMRKKPNQADLVEAIALGVVSGGFACFYNGGTYYEDYKGEKAKRIEVFLREYLKQISKV